MQVKSHRLENKSGIGLGVAQDIVANVVAGGNASGLRQRCRTSKGARNFQNIEGKSLVLFLGNANSVDFHDGFARKAISSGVTEKNETNEEQDQYDDHQAGVFADIFNHGRNI